MNDQPEETLGAFKYGDTIIGVELWSDTTPNYDRYRGKVIDFDPEDDSYCIEPSHIRDDSGWRVVKGSEYMQTWVSRTARPAPDTQPDEDEDEEYDEEADYRAGRYCYWA